MHMVKSCFSSGIEYLLIIDRRGLLNGLELFLP
jgi:hypothetical protein